MGVSELFFARGWGIRPSKKLPGGGLAGLELTDTLILKIPWTFFDSHDTQLFADLPWLEFTTSLKEPVKLIEKLEKSRGEKLIHFYSLCQICST